MNPVLLTITVLFFLFSVIRIVRMAGSSSTENEYQAAYESVLEEDSCIKLTDFIEKTESADFRNRARILKTYYDLSHESDLRNLSVSIDLDEIVVQKGRVNKNGLNKKWDLWIWSILVVAAAYQRGMNEVAHKFMSLFSVYEENMERQLEYKLLKGIFDCLFEKESEGCLSLEYIVSRNSFPKYNYNRRYLVLYQRFALATLDHFDSGSFDAKQKEELKKFGESSIGKRYLKELKKRKNH